MIGHGGLAWLLQRYPVATVMPNSLIAPVLSAIVAAVMFGTRVTGLMLLGGVVVMAGAAILTLRGAGKELILDEPAP